MGLLWSKPSPNWEKILSGLSSRITEVEQRVTLLRKQQRAWSVWLLSYGSLLYLLFVLWVFVYPRGPGLPYRPLLDGLGLAMGPLMIYYSRILVSWLYGRRIKYYDAKLREYRSQQRRKVEELKKATSYYKTKGLLERFELGDDDRERPKPPTDEKDAKEIIGDGKSLQDVAMIQKTATSSSTPSSNHQTINNMTTSPSSISSPLPQQQSLPSAPTPPTWLDRLVDAIIGDDRHSRYALICQKCFSHNGLARPDEFETIRKPIHQNFFGTITIIFVEYICPNCHHLNLPKLKPGSTDACVLVDDDDSDGGHPRKYDYHHHPRLLEKSNGNDRDSFSAFAGSTASTTSLSTTSLNSSNLPKADQGTPKQHSKKPIVATIANGLNDPANTSDNTTRNNNNSRRRLHRRKAANNVDASADD